MRVAVSPNPHRKIIMAFWKLIVIAAPSGCGKTRCKAILAKYPAMFFSVRNDTPDSERRSNGKDYLFLTKAEFEERFASRLVEWEEIYGNYYGTLKSEISRALHQSHMMLFDVDVKGALSIQKHFPNDSILIFIQPPNFEYWKNGWKIGHGEPETLKRRLERVPMEMEKGGTLIFKSWTTIYKSRRWSGWNSSNEHEEYYLITYIVHGGSTVSVKPIAMHEFLKQTGNIYEAIIVASKRARQIHDDMKIELTQQLETLKALNATPERKTIWKLQRWIRISLKLVSVWKKSKTDQTCYQVRIEVPLSLREYL